jgi:hypothetical protein
MESSDCRDRLAPPRPVCRRAQQGRRVGLPLQAPVAMEVSEWLCAKVPGLLQCGAYGEVSVDLIKLVVWGYAMTCLAPTRLPRRQNSPLAGDGSTDTVNCMFGYRVHLASAVVTVTESIFQGSPCLSCEERPPRGGSYLHLRV